MLKGKTKGWNFLFPICHQLLQKLQVSDDQLPKTDVSGSSSVGTFFGWAMDIYIFEWKTVSNLFKCELYNYIPVA